MIRLVALAVGALLLPQDALERKVDDLLPRLSDDAIDARDEAVKALADLGPGALPVLKARLEKLGGEARGRVEEAVRRIETAEALRRSLPPLKRVTLDVQDLPARQALEEIARQTGLTFDLSSCSADGAVTVRLKDAFPLQAIDEVCRRSGQIGYQVMDEDSWGRARRAVRGPRVFFHNGTFPEYPASYVRHYRVRVTTVSLTRTNTFAGHQASGQIQVDVMWPPDVRPAGMKHFRILEAKDDLGRSLVSASEEGAGPAFQRMRRYRGWDMSVNESVQIRYPEPDAKAVALLKGTAVFSYPKENRTLTFENPLECRGKILELYGLKITLKDYQDKGATHILELEVSGKFAGPGGEAPESASFFDTLPFSHEDIELVTSGGERLQNRGMSGRGDGKTYSYRLTMQGSKAEAVKEIRIPCVLSYFDDEVKFELRDIVLPK
jgi:hypothetical protein